MRKISIFLLQDTNDQNDQLKKLFSKEENFEIVGEGTKGESAISLIAEKKPRILLLEMVLSGYDGIYVINRYRLSSITNLNPTFDLSTDKNSFVCDSYSTIT